MDIRIENRDGEIINVSNMSIMVRGRSLIGLREDNSSILIESYKSEEKMRDEFRGIKEMIKEGVMYNRVGIYYKVGGEE